MISNTLILGERKTQKTFNQRHCLAALGTWPPSGPYLGILSSFTCPWAPFGQQTHSKKKNGETVRCTAPQKKKKHEILALPQGWWMVKSCHIKSLWRLVWDVHQETHKAFWPIGGGFNWDHGMRPSRKNSEVGADSGITKCPLFAQGSPPNGSFARDLQFIKKNCNFAYWKGVTKINQPSKNTYHTIHPKQNKGNSSASTINKSPLVFWWCFRFLFPMPWKSTTI